jgi:catechol 1,2-dioxygenase
MAEGYKPITTQIFDKDSEYLDNDSVFAVKDQLRVDFVPLKGDKDAQLELKYDVNMVGLTEQGESGDGLVAIGTGAGY